MNTFLQAVLLLCFAVGSVAFAQNPSNPAPQKHLAAELQFTSMMGTVREDGEKLTFVTDQRAWNVDNPQILKGHEGHYIRVTAHLDADKDSLHIKGVNMPTASETKKNDLR